jgi:hypothetical protein
MIGRGKTTVRITLALLLTLAAAWAQTPGNASAGSIFDVNKAVEWAQGGLAALQIGIQAAFIASIALFAWDIIRALFLEHSGIPGIFRGRLFWIPVSFMAFVIGLWAVAQMSQPVAVIYQLLIGNKCPFFWCP